MTYERSLDDASQPLEPICRHLRSKAMYVTGEMEPPADMQLTGSGHCWCNMTQAVFGPDAAVVDRRGCDASRTCYDGML